MAEAACSSALKAARHALEMALAVEAWFSPDHEHERGLVLAQVAVEAARRLLLEVEQRERFVEHMVKWPRLALYWVPPVPHPDPEYLYGVVLLANRRLLKRCFQAIARYLDPQSVMKLRQTTKEINREGERAMYRIWRYMVAAKLSSPFITIPEAGGAGQKSFTKAIYDLFFANKRQEVLIMGGEKSASSQCTNEVTKMIVGPDGTIRFEASTPMLFARSTHVSTYHQGEIFSFSNEVPINSQGIVERLNTCTKTQMQMHDESPDWYFTAFAGLGSTLYAIAGFNDEVDRYFPTDVVYTLNTHESQPEQGQWTEHAARLGMGRYCHAAIAFEGKIWVCGGYNEGWHSCVETFDPAIGVWQKQRYPMAKMRAEFTLLVYRGELYAVGGDGENEDTTIEKRNKTTGKWEMLTDLGVCRRGCAVALVGSRVFLFGGIGNRSTFDYYDLETKMWASRTKGGKYQKKTARKLPREVNWASAVLISPDKDWTDMNVVKLEDRDTTRYNERFEIGTGKAIQWDAEDA